MTSHFKLILAFGPRVDVYLQTFKYVSIWFNGCCGKRVGARKPVNNVTLSLQLTFLSRSATIVYSKFLWCL